ncbi:hypothetical protein HK096_006075, partial [Nowakowskiella sp. JEL0078]
MNTPANSEIAHSFTPSASPNRTWTTKTSVIVVERTKTDLEPVEDKVPEVTWSSVYKGVWSLTSTSTTVAASVAKSAARAAVAAAADSQTLNNAYKAASEAAARSQTLTSAIKVAKDAANTAANSHTLNTAYKFTKEAAANSQTLNTAYKSVKSLVVSVPGHSRRGSAVLSEPYSQVDSRRGSLAPSWNTSNILQMTKIYDEPFKEELKSEDVEKYRNEEKSDAVDDVLKSEENLIEVEKSKDENEFADLKKENISKESTQNNPEISVSIEVKPFAKVDNPSTYHNSVVPKTDSDKLISDLEVSEDASNTEFTHEPTTSAEISESKNVALQFEINKEDTLKRHQIIESLDKLIDEVKNECDAHDNEMLTDNQLKDRPELPQNESNTKTEILSKRKSRISTRTVIDENGELYVEDEIVEDHVIVHWEPFSDSENDTDENDSKIYKFPTNAVELDLKKPAMHRMVSQVRRVLRLRKKQSIPNNLISVNETVSTPSTSSSETTLTTPTTPRTKKVSLDEKQNSRGMDSPGLNLRHFTFLRSNSRNRNGVAETIASSDSSHPDSSNGDNGSVVSSEDSNGVEIQVEVMTRPLTPFNTKVREDHDLLDEDDYERFVNNTALAHSLVKFDDNEVSSLYTLDDKPRMTFVLPNLRFPHRSAASLSPQAVYDGYEERAERTRMRAMSGSLPKPYWDIGTPMKQISTENIEIKSEKPGIKKGLK